MSASSAFAFSFANSSAPSSYSSPICRPASPKHSALISYGDAENAAAAEAKITLQVNAVAVPEQQFTAAQKSISAKACLVADEEAQ